MSLGAQADRAQFGNQDPDVYFYGETIEKLGPRRYRITRGGVHDLRPADAALGGRRAAASR